MKRGGILALVGVIVIATGIWIDISEQDGKSLTIGAIVGGLLVFFGTWDWWSSDRDNGSD